IGDVISVKGILELPSSNRNFYLFNYQKYLKGKQIFWIIKAEELTLKKHATGFYLWKDKWIRKIEKRKNASYYFSFLLGDSSTLKAKSLYQELGISHLFAVSGMHILFIAGFLSKLFEKLCLKKFFSFLLIFLVLTFYIGLLSDSISANRAYLLYVFSFLNKHYKISLSSLKVLFYVAFLSILKNPFCILQIGFQFSFLICFFFMLVKRNSTGYIKTLWFTSGFAFLVSIPLSLYHFHQVHLGAIFFNMIAVPFVTIILFPLSFFSFLFAPFEFLFTFFILIFERIMYCFQFFNFLKLVFPSIPIFYVFLYYFVLLFGFKKCKKFFILFFSLLFLHFCIPYIDNHYWIDVIDVGEGDAILIRYPHLERSILVDCGGKIPLKENQTSQVETILIPYFKALGVKKIDVLIVTHGDYDHAGNALELSQKFPIKQILLNSGNDSDLEKSILKSLKIPITKIDKKTISIKNQKFQFLNSKNNKSENEDSLVFYTKLANKNILFMGDAGKNVENKIKKEYHLPKMDILKVGHHGSKNSSGKEFLMTIKPKIALISAGIGNHYGHPHDVTLENLSEIDSQIYSTNKQGSIQIQIKKSIKIHTCLP
ncbi:MAG: DNA internalization-related competence protein ComEC/Rec2, partial [Bacilli bacterium]|nr:DNA internalization-related competence protein ComEC/Rec2 [Bacilli bacterium]